MKTELSLQNFTTYVFAIKCVDHVLPNKMSNGWGKHDTLFPECLYGLFDGLTVFNFSGCYKTFTRNLCLLKVIHCLIITISL